MVIAAVAAAALFAGCVTALAGSMAGMRAVYLIAVPGLVGVGAVFALTRPEPLRFIFLALVAGLPFMSILVPPGRFGYTVFDAATLLLMAGLLLHMAFARKGTVAPLFPARSLVVMWLLLLPCVALARYPVLAAEALLLMFAAYVFFWFVLDELRRPSGFERLAALLAMAVLIVAVGLVIDHFFQMNLSFGGGNLNQRTMTAEGMVWRAGGFFQDPQKAGGFLAALLTFLVVLLVRGRFHGQWLRALAACAILGGAAALFLTVSRAAIMSFLLVSTVALVAANRWPAVLKLMGFLALGLLGVSLVVMPDLWMALLPSSFSTRLGSSREELLIRVDIWMDTWDMFANHPVTGIGFGGFQQYLLDTRPMVTNYYGIGVAEGVPYIPNQPESGYFKILYEGGIMGSLAVLVLIGATLRRGISAVASRHVGADERSQVIAALAGLAAFAITFATLFNTVDPRLLALFAILLAVVWQPSVRQSNPAARY